MINEEGIHTIKSTKHILKNLTINSLIKSYLLFIISFSHIILKGLDKVHIKIRGIKKLSINCSTNSIIYFLSIYKSDTGLAPPFNYGKTIFLNFLYLYLNANITPKLK